MIGEQMFGARNKWSGPPFVELRMYWGRLDFEGAWG